MNRRTATVPCLRRRWVIGIGDLGEFAVIDRFTRRFSQGKAVELGPGDDAAIVRAPDGRVVASTDLLLEGRHFRTDWSSAYDVGRKAAAQNLADVAAMGARPTALLLGFGCPPETEVSWAEALADGLRDECDLVGASVVGGDVVRAPLITLAVTALGDLGGFGPLTRSGARPGDLVAVRGRLGFAAAGLALLLGHWTAADVPRPGAATRTGADADPGAGPDPDGIGLRTGPGPLYGALTDGDAEQLIDAHRRPLPPYDAGPEALRLGATSLIDVSDGLAQDLGHIAAASRVRIDLDRSALPVPALLGPDGLRHVLTGGDDHAFAGTFHATTALPSTWKIIGTVAEGHGLTVDGEPPPGGGWDHFRA